ncbi:MAG: dethiobiotin synthase [Gammaproteobacteria bacterium]|nr:dethiobiotin synthase [Gammaproteobacteria bacterium]|tara:strand:- start:10174 stop:10845 length:672 start_codon:yes stop_codon:yes gene_type:complete
MIKIFITGNNTEVGKTYITLNLINTAIQNGKSVTPFKSVETGCKKIKKNLIPSDSKKFFQAINKTIDLDIINPYRYPQPISPYKAIKLSGKRIYTKNILDKIKKLPKSDILIMEGAGGAFSPLTSDGLNIDLIKKSNPKTVLVVKDELGAINNTLVNIESFIAKKVKVHAIILNRINSNMFKDIDNLKEIKMYTKIPIFQTYPSKLNKNKNVFKKLLNLLIKV